MYIHFAVDVFIVLSGFCLVLPTLSTGHLRGGKAQFYRRRATRILPPLYASLLFGLAVTAAVSKVSRTGQQLTWPVFATNFLLVQDWFPRWKFINPVTWSVALELKIYLLFPLLLVSARRIGWVGTACVSGVVSVGIAAVLARAVPQVDQSVACPWYLFLFAVGCTAAAHSGVRLDALKCRMVWSILAAALAAAVVLVWQNSHPPALPALATTVAEDGVIGVAMAAFLILLVGGHVRRAGRVLQTRGLVWVGTASYSLYLIHLPLLVIARILGNRLHFQSHTDAVRLATTAALGIPFVAVGTAVFFFAIERPFMTRRSPRRPADATLEAAVSPAP